MTVKRSFDSRNIWLAGVVAIGVATSIGVMTASQALAASNTTKQGAFTEEQAARGKAVYEKSCANCHPIDFYRDRLTRFENKSVSSLFEVVVATMPADNVGGLATSEYVDVLAYILSATGSPVGKTELTADNANDITIVGTK